MGSIQRHRILVGLLTGIVLALLMAVWILKSKPKWRFTNALPLATPTLCSGILKDGRAVVYVDDFQRPKAALQIFDLKTDSWSVQQVEHYARLSGLFQELPTCPVPYLCVSAFPWGEDSGDPGRMIRFPANDAARLKNGIVLSGGQIIVFTGNGTSNDLVGYFCLETPGKGEKWIEKPDGPVGAIYNVLPLSDGRLFICRSKFDDFWPPIEQIYNPKSDTWLTLSDPNIALGQTATLLPDGKILLVGGAVNVGEGYWVKIVDNIRQAIRERFYAGYHMRFASPTPNYRILATCRIYDPVTNTFRLTERLNMARAFHTANVLPDGRVLVTGGYIKPQKDATTKTCEIISLKDLEP